MKFNVVALLLGMVICRICIAQLPIPEGPKNIQSPNASSLGSFIDVPVSLFTGTPNIQVPIYNMTNTGGLSVPINLSYNARGFRPDEHPGWVGSGWSLEAGGVIIRNVKDMPDDYSNANYLYGGGAGFYFSHAMINNANWNQVAFMKTIAETDSSLKDSETDEYSFSYPGGSGKFYLDPTGNWQVKCDKPVKVSFDGSFLNVPFTAPAGTRMLTYGNAKTFSGFTITDENGNQFVFGGNTNAIEYSIPFFNQNLAEWSAQAWYITKIIPAYGTTIVFNYGRGGYVNQMNISIYNSVAVNSVNSSSGLFNPTPSCSSSEYRSVDASYSGMLIAPVYLSSIASSNLNVSFKTNTTNELRYANTVYAWNYTQWSQSSDINKGDFLPVLKAAAGGGAGSEYPTCLNQLQWKKLDTIIISNKLGTVLRKFIFGYNNDTNKRLFLQTLTEQDATGSSKPSYGFSYDSSVSLPGYLANMVDHWGYYNGTYADISNQQIYYLTYYSYREPKAQYLYAGTLNRIDYPTGGVTSFSYEPHQYSKRLAFNRANGIDATYNQLTSAGGLRIKKISYYDKNFSTSVKTREYFYVNGYNGSTEISTLPSSGILGGQIRYYFNDYRVTAFNDNNQIYSKSVFSSQSVLPACNNAMGSYIGYSHVTEKTDDGSFTNYYYSNFDNGHVDEAGTVLQLTRTAYEPYSSVDQERGQLLRQETFNNSGILLQKKTISYVALNKPNAYVPAVMGRYLNVCSNTAVSVSEAVAYKNYIYSYLASGDTTIVYDVQGSNPITTINKYTYNTSYRLLVSQVNINSKSDSIKTTRKYAFDNSTGIYTTMLTKNIISPVIELSQTYYKTGTSTQTKLQKVNYAQFTTKNLLMPQSVQEQNFSGTLDTVATYVSYDTSGNITEYQKKGAPTEAFLWGYNGEEAIAHATGASYSTIASVISQTQINTAISQGDASVRTLTGTLRTNDQTRGALVSSYTFAPGVGLTSETSSDGSNTFYEYDGFGRLINAKDNNFNMVKKYGYQYRTGGSTIVYFNAAKNVSLGVNNCSNNQLIPDTLTYTVPSGKYGSTVSQTAADQLAQNDINANGQNYVNANGACRALVTVNNISMANGGVSGILLFTDAQGNVFSIGNLGTGTTMKLLPGNYSVVLSTPGTNALIDMNGQSILANIPQGGQLTLGNFFISGPFNINASTTYFGNTAQSQIFTKNNCASGLQGSQVTYTVVANSYYSSISQSDANQKATANINANGQTYANNVGTCSALVSITLQKTSSVSGFDPVTVQISSSSNSNIGTYNFPSSNTGSTTISLPAGTYQLKFTLPSTTPYNVPFTLNGSQIANIASGLTTTGSATFSAGTNYTLKAVIGSKF